MAVQPRQSASVRAAAARERESGPEQSGEVSISVHADVLMQHYSSPRGTHTHDIRLQLFWSYIVALYVYRTLPCPCMWMRAHASIPRRNSRVHICIQSRRRRIAVLVNTAHSTWPLTWCHPCIACQITWPLRLQRGDVALQPLIWRRS